MDVLDGMSMWLDHRNDLLERRLHCFSKADKGMSHSKANVTKQICWASLSPGSAYQQQDQDLNLGSAKSKVQVISQQAKEMSQLQPPPGVWTSKYLFQQVIRVSTDGNCVQGWGEGQQLQRAWHKGWNCRNYSRRTSHHRWLVREVDFRESISASIFIAPLCRQTKLID